MNSTETHAPSVGRSLAVCLYCGLVIAAFALMLALPASRELFIRLTERHMFIMAFVKFALLATVGETIAVSINGGALRFPRGMVVKMGVWGVIGMGIGLMFPLFSAGIGYLQAGGILPGLGSAFATAFLSSVIINFSFGAVMMGFHTLTDTAIEMALAKEKITLKGIAGKTPWERYVCFVIVKTLPLFWIPAHTVTYLLPPHYRVFFSASLSIALGLILAIGKRKK